MARISRPMMGNVKTKGQKKVHKKVGARVKHAKEVQRIKRSKEDKEAKFRKSLTKEKRKPVLMRTEEAEDEDESQDEADGSAKKEGASFSGRMDVDAFLDHGFEKAMEEMGDDDDDDDDDGDDGGGDDDEEEDDDDVSDVSNVSDVSEDEGEEDDEEDDEEEDDDGDGEAPKAARQKRARDEKGASGGKRTSRSHKQELEQLALTDPDFYEYLQKTDQKLLGFEDGEGGDEEEEEEEEDDDDDDDDDVRADGSEEGSEDDDLCSDSDSAAGAPAAKPRAAPRAAAVEVSGEMVRGWEAELSGGASHAALKQLVSAFRSAVHFGDEDGDAASYAYTFTSGHVFNQLMQLCLGKMDEMLRLACAGSKKAAAKAAKTRAGLDRPDAWAHWKRHQPLVKSYLIHLTHFASKLSEAPMAAVVLQQMHRLLPFFLCLPKSCPKLLKAALRLWCAGPESGGSQQCTLLGFSIVRSLGASLPYPFIEHALKGLYLAYASSCRSTSRKTLTHIVLMSSCFVDMCAVDAQAAYQHAFVYIRQLAIHLRNAIQKASPDASRQVCNWQYVNCLRLWAQVLCAHGRGTTSPMRQLVYPLVQVTLGAARLLPSIRYAPMRLQCVRVLNQLCAELKVYAPVAPLLLETFNFAELSKPPTNSKTERLLDWATLVRVSAADAGKRAYQEGLASQALYLLAQHLRAICHSVAFPEMAAPATLGLRAAAKATKIVALQKRSRRLLSVIEKQAAWIDQKRNDVEFSPADAKAAAEFVGREAEAGSSPFAVWFAGEKADMERAEAEVGAQVDAQARGVRADAGDDDGDGDGDDDDGGGDKVGGDESDDDLDGGGGKSPKRAKKAEEGRGAKKKEKGGKGGKRKGGGSAGAHSNAGADEVGELHMSDLDSD